MKRLSIVVFMLAATAIAANASIFGLGKTVKASGQDTVLTFDISSDYTGINVYSAVKVVYSPSATKMKVTIDKNYAKFFEVRTVGSTLQIGIRKNIVHNSGSCPEVVVPGTSKTLKSIDLEGSCIFVSDMLIASPKLDVNVSETSQFMAEVIAGKLKIGARGASSVLLRGRAAYAEIECSGASTISGDKRSEFKVETAKVEISGAGRLEAMSGKEFKGSVSGASIISVNGAADVSQILKSGASKVYVKE